MTGTASPYRLVRELAVGGMGRIELVVKREGAFVRPYARKRLLPRFAKDPEVRAMFVEEGRLAGLVRHANVVGVIDVGEDADGPFLVMDLVDGVSLWDVVDQFRDELPVQVAAELGRQIAEGLHAAHELVAPDGRPLSLVHRDISLANVLVGFDGVARVTDFGVARAVDRGAMTRVGTVKGRLAYMSAEQLEQRALDRRADLYALGVVLCELLRGGRLHGDASPEEVARRTLEEPPPDPGELREDLPPELVQLVFELLARDREARPPTGRSVAKRLLGIVSRLRAEEGPVDVGELLSARFGEVRLRNAEMVRDALADRDGTELELEPDDEPAQSVPGLIASAETVIRALPVAAPPTRSRTHAIVGVAVGVLVALGIGAGLWVSRDEPTARLPRVPPASPAGAVQASEQPPRVEPASVAPAPTDEDATRVETVPGEPSGTDDSLVPVSSGSDPPEDAPPAAPARRGRPSSRSDGPPGAGSEIETWSWD